MTDLKRLAAVLHAIGCTKLHLDNMEELLKERDQTKCYYYLEESLEEEQPDHVKWRENAEYLCERLNATPTEALRIITNLLDLRRRLDEQIERNPNVEELSRLILFDERPGVSGAW